MSTENKYQPMQTMAPHYAKWFKGETAHVAATFNFRAGISRESVESAMRIFWHKEDCEQCGATQAKKNKKRIWRIGFLGGQAKARNWHYHYALKVPERFIADHPEWDETRYVPEYCAYLRQRWEQFEEAGKFSVFEPIENNALWVKYICEEEGFGDGEFCARTTYLGA